MQGSAVQSPLRQRPHQPFCNGRCGGLCNDVEFRHAPFCNGTCGGVCMSVPRVTTYVQGHGGASPPLPAPPPPPGPGGWHADIQTALDRVRGRAEMALGLGAPVFAEPLATPPPDLSAVAENKGGTLRAVAAEALAAVDSVVGSVASSERPVSRLSARAAPPSTMRDTLLTDAAPSNVDAASTARLRDASPSLDGGAPASVARAASSLRKPSSASASAAAAGDHTLSMRTGRLLSTQGGGGDDVEDPLDVTGRGTITSASDTSAAPVAGVSNNTNTAPTTPADGGLGTLDSIPEVPESGGGDDGATEATSCASDAAPPRWSCPRHNREYSFWCCDVGCNVLLCEVCAAHEHALHYTIPLPTQSALEDNLTSLLGAATQSHERMVLASGSATRREAQRRGMGVAADVGGAQQPALRLADQALDQLAQEADTSFDRVESRVSYLSGMLGTTRSTWTTINKAKLPTGPAGPPPPPPMYGRGMTAIAEENRYLMERVSRVC